MGRKKIDMFATLANPQANCRLLGLTPELRNMIWELALSVESDSNFAKKPTNVAARRSVLRLLETCRFIYCEAFGIFYSINTIQIAATSFWDGDSLGDLRRLTRLPPRRIAGISRLTMKLKGFCIELFTRLLKLLPLLVTLKTLQLVLEITHPHTHSETISEMAYIREHMARESFLLKKAAAKCTSIELVKVRYTGDIDLDTDFGRLVQEMLEQLLKMLPYRKLAKAAEAAAQTVANPNSTAAGARAKLHLFH